MDFGRGPTGEESTTLGVDSNRTISLSATPQQRQQQQQQQTFGIYDVFGVFDDLGTGTSQTILDRRVEQLSRLCHCQRSWTLSKSTKVFIGVLQVF
jgi:hypothetical protein